MRASRYKPELVNKFLEQGIEVGEQGIENSFELEQEVAEKVRNGYFTGDCFIYTTASGRLNYYVGGEVRACVRAFEAKSECGAFSFLFLVN